MNIIELNAVGNQVWGDFQTVISSTEAYLVKSEKLLFLAVVYHSQKKHYCGKGYVLFSNGELLGFKTTDDIQAKVINRCNLVAKRLAAQFGGTLERGRIDNKGVFQNH